MPPTRGTERILDKIADLADTLPPREFAALMDAVVADMADEGVSLTILSAMCGQVSDRIAVRTRRSLH